MDDGLKVGLIIFSDAAIGFAPSMGLVASAAAINPKTAMRSSSRVHPVL